jgi:hypothetical protein
MAFYYRLKRKDDLSVAKQLRKTFPELKEMLIVEIEERLSELDFDFYQDEKVKASLLVRLTIPFALVLMVLLVAAMPINYMITGRWGYKWQWLSNWFRSLGF